LETEIHSENEGKNEKQNERVSTTVRSHHYYQLKPVTELLEVQGWKALMMVIS